MDAFSIDSLSLIEPAFHTRVSPQIPSLHSGGNEPFTSVTEPAFTPPSPPRSHGGHYNVPTERLYNRSSYCSLRPVLAAEASRFPYRSSAAPVASRLLTGCVRYGRPGLTPACSAIQHWSGSQSAPSRDRDQPARGREPGSAVATAPPATLGGPRPTSHPTVAFDRAHRFPPPSRLRRPLKGLR